MFHSLKCLDLHIPLPPFLLITQHDTYRSTHTSNSIFVFFFYVLMTVQLSIFILVINQLDAKICFTISLFHAYTCFQHHVLIIRRPKLYYTASGVITPNLMHKNLFYNKFISYFYTFRGVMIPDAV